MFLSQIYDRFNILDIIGRATQTKLITIKLPNDQ